MTEEKEKKNKSNLFDRLRKQINMTAAMAAMQLATGSTEQAPPDVEDHTPKNFDPNATPDGFVRYTGDYRTAREALQRVYAADAEAPKPACAIDVHEAICELEHELETSNAAAGGQPPQDLITKLRAYRLAVSDAVAEARKQKKYTLPEKDLNCGEFKILKFDNKDKDYKKGE